MPLRPSSRSLPSRPARRGAATVVCGVALSGVTLLAAGAGASAATATSTTTSTTTATTATVRPTVTVATSASVVQPKQRFQLTAGVRADGAAQAGRLVTFWIKAPTAGSWSRLSSQLTDASGIARQTVATSRTLQYWATVAFPATSYTAASTAANRVGPRSGVTVVVRQPAALRLGRVLSTAAALRGRPYVYGAAGPRAFDCSGYTQYVYRTAAGISLPRTAGGQYAASRKISKSSIRPGDLVFFVGGGGVYHAAIYAGGGRIWHSPRPGKSVSLVPIWTGSWVAGRYL